MYLSGSHFCRKNAGWDPKGQLKGAKMENVWWAKRANNVYLSFANTCQDHTFAARIQDGIPSGSQRSEYGKRLMGKKTINDVYLNCASTCQDHTFAARIQDGTPRDSQRSERGQCLMAKKHKRLLFEFCSHLSGSYFCNKDPEWHPKKTTKGTKMENVRWVKNIHDFYLNFANTCQDHTFAARVQDGIPRGNQRNGNGKCLSSRCQYVLCFHFQNRVDVSTFGEGCFAFWDVLELQI